VSDAAAAAGTHDEAAVPSVPGRRQWLAVAGAAAIVACLVPPVATLARQYVFVGSAQFVVFSMAAPALIVLGAPWRWLRLSRQPAGPLDRLAAGRREHTSFVRAGAFLVAFAGICLLWRLPTVVNALARHPALVAAELVTLLAAGLGLWLELVPSPPLEPRLPRPHRAAVAALAMWSTWAVAYILGFSGHAMFDAYDAPGGGLSAIADQQIAVGLVWAVSGLCFAPVVFVAVIRWLKDNDNPDEELQRLARDERQQPVVRGWGRPAHGRRTSSAGKGH
jgi:putative membrane protein